MNTNSRWQFLVAAGIGFAFAATNEFVWQAFPEYIPTQPLADYLARIADQSVLYFAGTTVLDWLVYALIALPFAIIMAKTVEHVRPSILLVAAVAAGLVVVRFYIVSPSLLVSNPPKWQFVVMLLGICLALPIADTVLSFVIRKPQQQASTS